MDVGSGYADGIDLDDEVGVQPAGDLAQGGRAEAGGKFGRYETVARVSTGGMAEVFLARLRGAGNFSKWVAIKALLPELAKRSTIVKMFHDEAVLAARMSHPNICEVFEFNRERSRYFLVMEWLRGAAMPDYMRAVRRDVFLGDVRITASLLHQACTGLHYAHELEDDQGRPLELVHRDVSPANLFIGRHGRLKILDFGVAKSNAASTQTVTGVLKGKYAYMSPEQVNQPKTVDRRSDVFSLGVVLWESIIGRRLFSRQGEFDTLKAVVEARIPTVSELRPEVPPQISAVVARALARQRNERYQTAGEFADALEQAANDTLGGIMPAASLAEALAPYIVEQPLPRRRTGASEAEESSSTDLAPTRPASSPESLSASPRDTHRQTSAEPDSLADGSARGSAVDARAGSSPADRRAALLAAEDEPTTELPEDSPGPVRRCSPAAGKNSRFPTNVTTEVSARGDDPRSAFDLGDDVTAVDPQPDAAVVAAKRTPVAPVAQDDLVTEVVSSYPLANEIRGRPSAKDALPDTRGISGSLSVEHRITRPLLPSSHQVSGTTDSGRSLPLRANPTSRETAIPGPEPVAATPRAGGDTKMIPRHRPTQWRRPTRFERAWRPLTIAAFVVVGVLTALGIAQ